MPQYIGSGQKKQFDVGNQELVSKVQKMGDFWEKTFLGSIFGGFMIFVL